MKVKYQYVDHTEWEGPPDRAHLSPDKGIIRMYAICDHDTVLTFEYQDIYYLYWSPRVGGWLFGGCNPYREFIFYPGVPGCEGKEVPLVLPESAVIRHGETVSQEEAVKFGLISSLYEKDLHPKRRVLVETYKECGE